MRFMPVWKGGQVEQERRVFGEGGAGFEGCDASEGEGVHVFQGGSGGRGKGEGQG